MNFKPKILFPFLIGKVLTFELDGIEGYQLYGFHSLQVRYLLVARSKTNSYSPESFPFLIGKVLTGDIVAVPSMTPSLSFHSLQVRYLQLRANSSFKGEGQDVSIPYR